MISKDTVAFPRTSLMITADTGCRMTLHGYTTLNFNADYKVVQAYDHWDNTEMEAQWQGCQFPSRRVPQPTAEPIL